MIKRFIFLLLQAFVMLGLNAEVLTGSCGTTLTYNLDTSTGVLKIEGNGDMEDYNYSGPQAPWYAYRTSIVTLNLSESLTSIGEFAFGDCSSLTSVTIPNSVTSIGVSAFSGCSGLTSVAIPNSVTSIGDGAFGFCSGLTSVTIPNSVTSIGDYAFYDCSGLTSVTIPNSVTRIGRYAFSGCSGLTSVTIPNSVTSIGDRAFEGCTNVKELIYAEGCTTALNTYLTSIERVTIPNSVTSIGSYAFSYCSGLTSVTIPNSVTSIAYTAFEGCSGLTSVVVGCKDNEDFANYIQRNDIKSIFYTSDLSQKTHSIYVGGEEQTKIVIPNSVTSIGDYAFRNCSSLTSVTIPNSVTSIGDYAFRNCSSLTSVVVGCKDNEDFANYIQRNDIESIFYTSGLYQKTHSIYVGGEEQTKIVIPNSVTSIGDYAFRDCSSLTSVTIPNSVTSIGSYAFYGCTSLPVVDNIRYADTYLVEAVDKEQEEYKIKEDTRFIGNSAFKDCSDLTSVTILNSVTSIGNEAFSGCSGLTSVTIPNSVTSIGDYAFKGCPIKDLSIDSEEFCKDEYFGHGIKTLVIGNSVTSIGESAFRDCSALTSVTIPNSVTSIGESAFRDCSALTSVTIPNSVTSIGSSAFSGCSRLTSVVVGCKDNEDFANYIQRNDINSIFYTYDLSQKTHSIYVGGEEQTKIVIPNSVTSIGSSAFWNCSSLTSITIPNSVTSIGKSAFSGCSGLTSMTIPNSVTSIGDYAFYNCSGLTSVAIPNSVTSIGASAFYNCSSLTSVIIPNSVTSIGSSAFSGCSGLREIHSNATTPPSAASNTFDGVNTNYCKLYVPIGSKEDYAFATGWQAFMNIIEENVITDGDNKCEAPSIEYVDGHLKFSSTTPDATFLYTLTCNDVKTSLENCENGDVPLSASYKIIAYAQAEGYDTSDPATATLHWIEASIDNGDGPVQIVAPKRGILINTTDGFVTITGLEENEVVEAYTTDGKYITTTRAAGNAATITANVGDVVILKIAGESLKVNVR